MTKGVQQNKMTCRYTPAKRVLSLPTLTTGICERGIRSSARKFGTCVGLLTSERQVPNSRDIDIAEMKPTRPHKCHAHNFLPPKRRFVCHALLVTRGILWPGALLQAPSCYILQRGYHGGRPRDDFPGGSDYIIGGTYHRGCCFSYKP